MGKLIEAVLKEVGPLLVEQLNPEHAADYFWTKGIISTEERDNEISKITRVERSEELITTLRNKDDSVLDELVAYLEQHSQYSYFVMYIEEFKKRLLEEDEEERLPSRREGLIKNYENSPSKYDLMCAFKIGEQNFIKSIDSINQSSNMERTDVISSLYQCRQHIHLILDRAGGPIVGQEAQLSELTKRRHLVKQFTGLFLDQVLRKLNEYFGYISGSGGGSGRNESHLTALAGLIEIETPVLRFNVLKPIALTFSTLYHSRKAEAAVRLFHFGCSEPPLKSIVTLLVEVAVDYFIYNYDQLSQLSNDNWRTSMLLLTEDMVERMFNYIEKNTDKIELKLNDKTSLQSDKRVLFDAISNGTSKVKLRRVGNIREIIGRGNVIKGADNGVLVKCNTIMEFPTTGNLFPDSPVVATFVKQMKFDIVESRILGITFKLRHKFVVNDVRLEVICKEVEQALENQRQDISLRGIVLYGKGHYGQTSIARYYAMEFSRNNFHKVVLNCSGLDMLKKDLQELSASHDLPFSSTSNLDDVSVPMLINMVMRHFSKSPKEYLLVLKNCNCNHIKDIWRHAENPAIDDRIRWNGTPVVLVFTSEDIEVTQIQGMPAVQEVLRPEIHEVQNMIKDLATYWNIILSPEILDLVGQLWGNIDTLKVLKDIFRVTIRETGRNADQIEAYLRRFLESKAAAVVKGVSATNEHEDLRWKPSWIGRARLHLNLQSKRSKSSRLTKLSLNVLYFLAHLGLTFIPKALLRGLFRKGIVKFGNGNICYPDEEIKELISRFWLRDLTLHDAIYLKEYNRAGILEYLKSKPGFYEESLKSSIYHIVRLYHVASSEGEKANLVQLAESLRTTATTAHTQPVQSSWMNEPEELPTLSQFIVQYLCNV